MNRERIQFLDEESERYFSRAAELQQLANHARARGWKLHRESMRLAAGETDARPVCAKEESC